ncbi:hypothetical protein NLI96_g1271 [Meripilus lineatus]|uniref:Uncharacterized protein n=1 Tax=Meripilus lineatus TaxID=2056292 RepID=A0AAD5VF66_9APHY|nr:hypothetical protein NLI96_g1271 [Physisporinus lineatus]
MDLNIDTRKVWSAYLQFVEEDIGTVFTFGVLGYLFNSEKVMLNDAPALSILIASMLYMIAGIVAFGMKGRIRAYKGLSANGIKKHFGKNPKLNAYLFSLPVMIMSLGVWVFVAGLWILLSRSDNFSPEERVCLGFLCAVLIISTLWITFAPVPKCEDVDFISDFGTSPDTNSAHNHAGHIQVNIDIKLRARATGAEIPIGTG